MHGARILDENRPCLQWLSATELGVSAHTPDLQDNPQLGGPDARWYVQLRDGRRYACDSFTLDATVVGEGGLDVAPAATAWYYVYLVPSALNPAVLTVIGSLRGPMVGPTGYSAWVYCGCARWDWLIATWHPFRYQGHGKVLFTYGLEVLNEAAADDANPVAVNLADAAFDALPAATYSADIQYAGVLTLGGGSGIRLNLWAALDNGITAPTWAALVPQEIITDGTQDVGNLTIPGPPASITPYLWYQREDLTAGSTLALIVAVTGFVDFYLR